MHVRELLVCPTCKSAKLGQSDSARSELRCPGCDARFPAADGVVDLLPGVEHEPSRAQRSMQWAPLVRIYESRLWRRNPLVERRMGISFEREYALIAEAGAFAEAECVLDLACGPGIYTRRFARLAPDALIVGLDLSPPMLAHAARSVEEERIENLALVHASADDLPFEPEQFDAVNCCGALHLFPDQPRVLAEVARVLRPGGRFTAAVFRREEAGLRARWANAASRFIGLQTFTPQSLEDLCATAGLSDFEVLHPGRKWMVTTARRPGRDAPSLEERSADPND
jgi:SAM-dependent methyltransferase